MNREPGPWRVVAILPYVVRHNQPDSVTMFRRANVLAVLIIGAVACGGFVIGRLSTRSSADSTRVKPEVPSVLDRLPDATASAGRGSVWDSIAVPATTARVALGELLAAPIAFTVVFAGLTFLFRGGRSRFARLHVGQLTIIWVVCVPVILLVAAVISPALLDSSFRGSIAVDVACGAALAVCLAVVLFPVAVSWVWFGARQRALTGG